MKSYKISFCTVCMNRLHHLKQTLPDNIRDNSDYDELDFVVLDYNSTDGLEEFIRNNLSDFIKTGKLKYYRTTEPVFFHRSHSRNVAFKLAEGEVICNIDADNYTGKGFAAYVNTEFKKNESIFLCTLGFSRENKKDLLGRICVRKKDFLEIKGYDEIMQSYGFEDYDLINRLEMNGIKPKGIDNSEFLLALEHTDSERIAEEYVKKEFEYLMIRYIEPSLSELIIFLKDKKYFKGIVIENYAVNSVTPQCADKFIHHEYHYSLQESGWLSGKWRVEGNNFHLDSNDCHYLALQTDGSYSYSDALQMNKLFVIDDPGVIEEAVFFFSQVTNRERMERNKREKMKIVNQKVFGAATVHMNFEKHPIRI